MATNQMEFYTTKRNGYEFNVVFNGGKYVFFNSYCGIAAVAERTTTPEEVGTGNESFNIKYGNDHLVGGSMGYDAILPVVKRIVNAAENKYISKKIKYTTERVDLSRWYATINVCER